jgi:hypothetical protein
LITVRVFEVQADGIAMADRADNRHVVLEEKTVEFFDVGQTGASERNCCTTLPSSRPGISSNS